MESQTILRDIISQLKNYPFLLITIAGMILLFGALGFDIEVLKEFKPLITAFILIPLVFQFFLEYKKAKDRASARERAREMGVPVEPGANLKLSGKAVTSVVLAVIALVSVGTTEGSGLGSRELWQVVLAFSLVAGILGLLAWADVNHQRARGKTLATIATTLSLILLLGAVGNLMDGGPAPSAPPSAPPDLPPPPSPPPAQSQWQEFALAGASFNGAPLQIYGGHLRIRQIDASTSEVEQSARVLGPLGQQMEVRHVYRWIAQPNGLHAQILQSNDPMLPAGAVIPVTSQAAPNQLQLTFFTGGNQLTFAWTALHR